MIGIIDYGAGNLQSVRNALDFLGQKCEIINDPNLVCKFDRIILPGVGAFGDAMQKLRANNLDESIKEFIKSGKPFLGICLGMQLLFEKSDEFGENLGLGVIKGEVIRFDENKFDKKLKIPHVGWNCVNFKKSNAITKNLNSSIYFYFVHSYHVVPKEDCVLATSEYGYEFVSAICKDNIIAFQPHPEKSHKNGILIFRNFMEM
ncbi:imidazole glycerol phosphate synthase subunit HisH [Campylobacter sp. RM12327]|uniref:imidazole glycerol phosphate synthase subunit HisH n=1 Tax=Campylobacter sputorum TaxID=206 RepID=UPI000B76B900|nr:MULTISPECIES: imidazole glycerol phosphate synthase subunit HisH [Campylobacter]ASM40451.1 imidazole glycerol phosphate synthase HisFH, HisH subunit [Campylobacter sputorum]MBE7357274.1 imidazole glycerol phosphate synthase subunit HisH [Campylobacter sp. RM11302]MBF6668584.1 imidazole glycerol phosphate synthase subunit HisH [Campylobacter sp. RM12327]MBF6674161.1 imidazole glycerol phosphate synthase subunit HisH [Campylobacter sp. RM13538]MBF6675630.1 imidazole glycerol phosphate synthas